MIELDEIKAKDYFKAVKQGKPDLVGGEDAFIRINDLYFLARNSQKDKTDLNNKLSLSNLQYHLQVLKTSKVVYQRLYLDDHRRKQIESYLKRIGFEIKHKDIQGDEKAKDIDRQFQVAIGKVKNKIEIKKLNLHDETSEGKDINFSEIIVSFEMVLEKSISEDLSLGKFIAYEKMASRKIREQQNRK